MDPSLDPPPPAAAQPPAAVVPSIPVAAAANPSPIQPSAHNHPPYAEMITAAIAALKEQDGSSKRAIARYIESNYTDLPSTHSALLTHHLKRLKINGQLVMVKYSYKLPGSAPPPAPLNGPVDPASAAPKRRPGRPPKPKPDAIQEAVPVFASPADVNAAPQQQDVAVAAVEQQGTTYVPVNGAPLAKRGRGRPPRQGGVPKLAAFKRGPGRPPKSAGRGRGRPPKKNVAPPAGGVAAAIVKGSGRPRGRPPKPINVVEGLAPAGGGLAPANVVAMPLVGKRRGRPPKGGGVAKKPRNLNAAGQPKKLRRLSGKPLGRPKKGTSATVTATVTRTPDSQLLVAYLDLKAKLENLQSRVKQTAALIKPSLSTEAAINALGELEQLATNANAPPNTQSQPQPQPQPQPESEQPQPQAQNF